MAWSRSLQLYHGILVSPLLVTEQDSHYLHVGGQLYDSALGTCFQRCIAQRHKMVILALKGASNLVRNGRMTSSWANNVLVVAGFLMKTASFSNNNEAELR